MAPIFGSRKPTETPKAESPADAGRRQRLAELTATAKKGLVAFAEVGLALEAIRTEELWRLEAATWAAWCEATLKLTDRRVAQLVEAATTARMLVEVGLRAPTTERAVRELAGLPAETAAVVWQEAVSDAEGGDPTAEQVAARARARKPRKGRKATARARSYRVPGATVRVTPRRNGWAGYVAALEHALKLALAAEAGDEAKAA